ncbi:hypothetical protein ON010_g18104 [Phytophthora cinnamomi]|nr:hypothetical protein ON010_g18104 [Phytophthora cinnamomi]
MKKLLLRDASNAGWVAAQEARTKQNNVNVQIRIQAFPELSRKSRANIDGKAAEARIQQQQIRRFCGDTIASAIEVAFAQLSLQCGESPLGVLPTNKHYRCGVAVPQHQVPVSAQCHNAHCQTWTVQMLESVACALDCAKARVGTFHARDCAEARVGALYTRDCAEARVGALHSRLLKLESVLFMLVTMSAASTSNLKYLDRPLLSARGIPRRRWRAIDPAL